MSKYYFDSNQIQVFPCANRTADEASKFTTEYNLTHLGGLRTEIISNNPMYPNDQTNKARLIQCWVKGYYFKFICNPDAPGFPGGNNLYLQVNIPDNTDFPALVVQQGKLVPFDGKKALDQDGKFYGAKLTDEPPTHPDLALILKKGGGWLTDTIPSQLHLLGPDSKTYTISIKNVDGNMQVVATIPEVQ